MFLRLSDNVLHINIDQIVCIKYPTAGKVSYTLYMSNGKELRIKKEEMERLLEVIGSEIKCSKVFIPAADLTNYVEEAE
jgi:hypothetical protein